MIYFTFSLLLVLISFSQAHAGSSNGAKRKSSFETSRMMPNACSRLPLIKEPEQFTSKNISEDEAAEKIAVHLMRLGTQGYYKELCDAAENGVIDAQIWWGDAFTGSRAGDEYLSISRNDVFAYMWYNIASKNSSRAREIRDRFSKKMTAKQIAEAENLTEEWFKKHPSLPKDEEHGPWEYYAALKKSLTDNRAQRPPDFVFDEQQNSIQEQGLREYYAALSQKKLPSPTALMDACNGHKLGLPSDDFTKKMSLSAINEFYGCYKPKYLKAAQAAGTEDFIINYVIQLSSFLESLWRRIIEKSITPGQASQELVIFKEHLRHNMLMEGKE